MILDKIFISKHFKAAAFSYSKGQHYNRNRNWTRLNMCLGLQIGQVNPDPDTPTGNS